MLTGIPLGLCTSRQAESRGKGRSDVGKRRRREMPGHGSLQLSVAIVPSVTFTRPFALLARRSLNLFYGCHRAAVTFTAPHSSHSTLWLIFPIKLRSCATFCTRVHPSALSSLQLMLFPLSPVKYSVIICIAGGVSIQEVCSGVGGGGKGGMDIETIPPVHLKCQWLGTTI
jgi:hypothetical protein